MKRGGARAAGLPGGLPGGLNRLPGPCCTAAVARRAGRGRLPPAVAVVTGLALLLGGAAGCGRPETAGPPAPAAAGSPAGAPDAGRPGAEPADAAAAAAGELGAAPAGEGAPEGDPPLANRVRWSTASEVDNFGYHVYRGDGEDGPWVRLTGRPIAGAGTTDLTTDYLFVDDTIEPDREYFYWVESIAMDGSRERFTPILRAPAKPAPG